MLFGRCLSAYAHGMQTHATRESKAVQSTVCGSVKREGKPVCQRRGATVYRVIQLTGFWLLPKPRARADGGDRTIKEQADCRVFARGWYKAGGKT